MAKMLPKWVDPTHTKSSAECRLFDLLRDAPGTETWTVVHSLGMVRTQNRPYGEIDFVVIIPDLAIICLEIKGGGIACDHGGVWTTTDRHGTVHRLSRSPFDQAKDAMFSLRKSLMDQIPSCEAAIGFAVVMPDIHFDVKCVSWDRDTLIDERDFPPKTGSIVQGVTRIAIATQRRHPYAKPIDSAMVRLVTGFLRPSFERAITLSTVVGRIEHLIGSYTEEQFDMLDRFADNPRCLFQGAAGTGKTMIAVELARRSAASGKRTLLVCYNRMLGTWLGLRVKAEHKDLPIEAGSLHRILRRVIDSDEEVRRSFAELERQTVSSGDDERDEAARDAEIKLFGEDYHEATMKVAAKLSSQAKYDQIVVDEAQDVCSEAALLSLDSLLNGGLREGNWSFFGDFSRQAIYSRDTTEVLTERITRCALNVSRGRLTTNCRNTRNIALETAAVSGFETPPSRSGVQDGPPVDRRYFGSDAEQRTAMQEVVGDMLAQGVKPNDIVILSRFTSRNSPAFNHTYSGFRLATAKNDGARTPTILFTTTHAFKGMESPVVIVADCIGEMDEMHKKLLYVAMSRARTRLTLMISERLRPYIDAATAQQVKWQLGIH